MSQDTDIFSTDGIPQRLGRIARLSGLAKQDFANLLGKSSRIISLWEKGEVPLSLKNAKHIVEAVRQIGIISSVEWLLTGQGLLPYYSDSPPPVISTEKNLKEFPEFAAFGLDFSIAGLINFYRQVYPNCLYLMIENDRFQDFRAKTLLIAASIPQAKYQPDWPYGYLYSITSSNIIPGTISQTEQGLIFAPTPQRGYQSTPILLTQEERIHPIITIRPTY